MSAENHAWFNKQDKVVQAEMNRRFQEYKKCKIVFVDHLDTDIKIRVGELSLKPDLGLKKTEYNRAKAKREFERRVDEEWER